MSYVLCILTYLILVNDKVINKGGEIADISNNGQSYSCWQLIKAEYVENNYFMDILFYVLGIMFYV